MLIILKFPRSIAGRMFETPVLDHGKELITSFTHLENLVQATE